MPPLSRSGFTGKYKRGGNNQVFVEIRFPNGAAEGRPWPSLKRIHSMTNWTSGVCKANGIHIHYLRTGGCKPPLVLLHGLTASGACWIPLARALEAEYDVVMPDAPGHGNSSSPLNGYRYEDHANDVVGLIPGLALVAPVLVGHSMGGMTAALIASREAASTRAVILADPAFLNSQRQREVHESDVVEQHRQLLASNKRDVLAQLCARHSNRSSELIQLLAESRLLTRIQAFEVLTPPNPEYRELVRAICVPILLIIGDNGVVSLESARELQSLNPRVRIEQIRNVGHGIPYDQPDCFEAAVKSFLRSLDAP
jgi:N-formylmaleamate deformylase